MTPKEHKENKEVKAILEEFEKTYSEIVGLGYSSSQAKGIVTGIKNMISQAFDAGARWGREEVISEIKEYIDYYDDGIWNGRETLDELLSNLNKDNGQHQ